MPLLNSRAKEDEDLQEQGTLERVELAGESHRSVTHWLCRLTKLTIYGPPLGL